MYCDLHQFAFASSGKEAGVLSSSATECLDLPAGPFFVSVLIRDTKYFVCVADVCSPDGSLCTTGSCPLAGAGNGCNPDGQTHLCLTVLLTDLLAA